MADLNNEEQAFYYVDGMPTKGCWITLHDTLDEDEIKETLADQGFILRNQDAEPDYDGDLLVACVTGDVAACFLDKYDCFDLAGWIEVCEEAPDHVDAEAIAAYLGYVGRWSKSDFEEVYMGAHDSEKAFIYEYVDDIGLLNGVHQDIAMYFDYDAYARDRFIDDFYMHDGHVFRRN